MKKLTIVDQVEIRADGEIRVRFAKQIVDGGGAVLASSWHRAAFLPGDDIDAGMIAVNESLAGLNEAPCDDYTIIKSHAKVAHTKAAIATRRERDAAAAAEVAALLASQVVPVENAPQ